MKAGRLRHWVVLETKTKTRNTLGEETVAWTTNIGTWADVKPLRGSNYFASMQLQSAITHSVTMRYQTLANSTEIRPGYTRVKLGDRPLAIQSVINPEERNIYLELMCIEDLSDR